MNTFGSVKTKILKKLLESYGSQNKDEMKDILRTISANKDFKEMYLFYEEVENKYFDDTDVAKLYVEELNTILKNKFTTIKEFCQTLNERIGSIEVEINPLYSNLDQLLEDDNLTNIEKKVIAKKKLFEHLTTKKEIESKKSNQHTVHENLLNSVLANNFNVLYGHSLNEEQKIQLKSILSLSSDELSFKSNEIKESLFSKIDTLLNESSDVSLKSKLGNVKDEVNRMEISKYNYYRLLELKNGLN